MAYGIKHIAILYLLVVLSFASAGINIYASYCGCSRLAEYSLSEPESCCQTHAHSSCHVDPEHAGEQHGRELEGGCCNKHKITLKIEQEFIASASVAAPFLVVLHTLFCRFSLSQESLASGITACSRYDMIKPKLHGKGLVCFLHSFKIPDTV